jgi:hypothetical protein
VFYTAAAGTTVPFVDIKLNGDDDDNGDGASAATHEGDGAGGSGRGGQVGDNVGGGHSASGGARGMVSKAGAGDDSSKYGDLTTVVKDSAFGDGTRTHSGVADSLLPAVRKGAIRLCEEVIELKLSECLLLNILVSFPIYPFNICKKKFVSFFCRVRLVVSR